MLVQAIPSIYEKQMEISNLSIQDLFGSKQKIERSSKGRTFSENKVLPKHKRLSKIEENTHKKKTGAGNIHAKMYFKSPEKSEHSDG